MMGQQTLQLTVQLMSEDCGQCGGTYAINERYRKQCQDYGKSWTCPYCKADWGFEGEGALQEVERALTQEKERHSRTLARENTERAAKEKLARKLTRVSRGVCPECNRTLSNLARHMASKHEKRKDAD